MVCPIETLLVAGKAVQRLIEALMTRGRCDLPDAEMMTFAEVKKVLGLDEVMGLRERLGGGYSPGKNDVATHKPEARAKGRTSLKAPAKAGGVLRWHLRLVCFFVAGV